MSKALVGDSGLFFDKEVANFLVTGDKDTATLYFSNEYWEEGDASLYKLSSDGCGTEVEVSIEAAEELYHCLGAILGK